MRHLVVLLPFILSGCVAGTVASTAVDVVTLPVKVVSAGVNAATTSQSEADEKRGRLAREMYERCRKGRPIPTDDCTAVQR
jgi:hypothetical protein